MNNMKINNTDSPGMDSPKWDSDKIYKKHIKEYQNFPIDGVTYYDLNPIYEKPAVRNLLVTDIYNQIKDGIEVGIYEDFDYIGVIESRGYIIGSMLAHDLNKGLIMLRSKPNRLPGKTSKVKHTLEYGDAQMEVQKETAKTEAEIQLEQIKAQLESQRMGEEVEYKKQLMQLEFEMNMQLKDIEVEGQKTKERMKEDRKDERTRIQATQQSELIDQRNTGKPPKNFESAGNDILSGAFDLGTFDPR